MGSHNDSDGEEDGDVDGPMQLEDGTVSYRWRREYRQGCQYEVYRIPLPPACQGLTFSDVR